MSENLIFSDEELEIIRNGQVLGSYYPIEQEDEYQEALGADEGEAEE